MAGADAVPEAADRLGDWLAAGHHGTMDWMEATRGRRASPRALWDGVRSVVMLGRSYAPPHDPLAALARRGHGLVAAYASRRDYHDVLKGQLKDLAGFLQARSGHEVKVFVDTAPVMEKPLAAASGLGWTGKHSCVVSRRHGSWLLLGTIFTAALLPADDAEVERCGSCTRCLDICPTGAFAGPYRLDSRRCIAYLTIEHAGHIPAEFRPAIGNRVFGCDDCLAVCPWNRFAEVSRDARLGFRQDISTPSLRDLARLDEAGFRALFAGTPVKRTGRDRVLRNVLIAIGNSGDPGLAPEAERCLADPSPLVRAMAVWAVRRLLGRAGVAALAGHAAGEPDPDVAAEWSAALAADEPAGGGAPGAGGPLAEDGSPAEDRPGTGPQGAGAMRRIREGPPPPVSVSA